MYDNKEDALADAMRKAYHNPKSEKQIIQPVGWDNVTGDEKARWRAVATTGYKLVHAAIGMSLLNEAGIKGRQ